MTVSNRLKWVITLIVVGVAVQLLAGTTHRTVAFFAFLGSIGLWGLLVHGMTRETKRAYWIVPVLASAWAVTLVLAVGIAPATSKDFNSYSLYGRMVAEYHESPYTHTPAEFAADPWFARTSAFWSDTPSVYGPVFTGVSAGIMRAAGPDELPARLGFQLVAAASLCAAVALASRRLGWGGAIACIGLNPLLLTFGVNDAHADMLVGTLLLAAVLALDRPSTRAPATNRTPWLWLMVAGALFGLAVLVKVTALPALVGALVWLWSRPGARGVALQRCTTVLAAFTAVTGAATVLGGGLDTLRPLLHAAGRHTRFSLWNPVHQLLSNVTDAALPSYSFADNAVSLLANISVLAVTLVLMFRYRRHHHAYLTVAVGLVAYQLLGAYVLSWYVAWSLPVLALRPGTRPAVLAVAHASWVALAYFSGWGIVIVTACALSILIRQRRRVAAWWREAASMEASDADALTPSGRFREKVAPS